MCNFCDLKNKKFMGLTGEERRGYGYAPYVFIRKDSVDDKIYLYACGEEDTIFQITYCPICGNKLQ